MSNALEYAWEALLSKEYCCLPCAMRRLTQEIEKEYARTLRLGEERRTIERGPVWSPPI